MQKTQKAQAIKKLQSELKKEKEDELTRFLQRSWGLCTNNTHLGGGK